MPYPFLTVDPDGLPNLDGMDDLELLKFALWHNAGDNHGELFVPPTVGGRQATRDLSHYAWNALTARGCRLKGEITEAKKYEAICQTIYHGLPAWARW